MTKDDYLLKLSMLSAKTKMPINQLIRDEIQRIQVVGEETLEKLKAENPFLTDEDIKVLRSNRSVRTAEECVERIRMAMKEYKDSQSKEKNSSIKGIEIDSKLINVLKGFAVIREEKTGRIHIFYQDPKKKSLKGRLESNTISMQAQSGFYVNFEEFMDQMASIIGRTNEDVEASKFIKKDGTELSYLDVMKELYKELKQAGAISFGNEIGKRRFDTLEELKSLQLKGRENFLEESLKTGVYVRRDMLISVLSEYKLVPPGNKERKGNPVK